MSGPSRDLEQAKAEALIARERLTVTLGEIQERLNPRAILHEAWTDLRERGDQAAGDAIDLARARPGATVGVAAAIVVVLLRHPLSRAVTSLFLSRRATEEQDDKLTAQDRPAAAKPRRRAAAAPKGD